MRFSRPRSTLINVSCVSHVRVLSQKFAMGFGTNGGRARGGSTSRKESNEGSEEKKEASPSIEKTSADQTRIRKLVAKFLKEQAATTNLKKAPRLLHRLSEDMIRALGFMSKLTGKYVTDAELIAKYVEAERRRKEWFESEARGWDFTPNVDPHQLPQALMSYGSVVDINGMPVTVQIDEKNDDFIKFRLGVMGTSEGPLRTAEYS